jgi:hypothetical protein
MVHNTQIRWASRLCAFSGILKARKNKMFWKLDLLQSLGEGIGGAPTLLSPLERGNLSHWTLDIS